MTERAPAAEAGAPIEHDEARRAAQAALDHPGADAVDVVISGSHIGLTRYAVSEIIQNTVRNELRAWVRVVVGDRIASASTNQLDARSIETAASQALDGALASRPDADFPGLPKPETVGRAQPVFRFDERTGSSSPETRSRSVRRLIDACGGANAAGIYETSAHCHGVFSSTGIDCYDSYTRCVATCLVDLGESTGWGETSSHSRDEVDVERAATAAVAKAKAGAGASDAPPGSYEVVLEPSAVALLIEYLSYAGFGAKQVIEGESFLATKARQNVAPPGVTVADDVHHPSSVGIGFDFEGVPRRRVAVIDRGRTTGPVTDLRTAQQLGVEPTGHFSGSNEYGPYAWNVVLEAGDKDLDELIGEVEEGLLVTRFHYVNILDRPATLLTGMTRDGTFRITRGEVAGAVHNFRFTQSVLDALSSVQGIGRDLTAIAPEFGSFGSTVAPALRVSDFRFTSTTSH